MAAPAVIVIAILAALTIVMFIAVIAASDPAGTQRMGSAGPVHMRCLHLRDGARGARGRRCRGGASLVRTQRRTELALAQVRR